MASTCRVLVSSWPKDTFAGPAPPTGGQNFHLHLQTPTTFAISFTNLILLNVLNVAPLVIEKPYCGLPLLEVVFWFLFQYRLHLYLDIQWELSWLH